MRAIIIAALITLILAAAAPHAEEARSYVVVGNEAPYPIIAEVMHRLEGTLAEVPVLPGEEARITVAPGNYILGIRPAVPFYYVDLPATPEILIRNPYVIVPIELGPGEEYAYTYTLGNITGTGAGIVVLRSALNISALTIDDSVFIRTGSFPDSEGNYYRAIIMIGEGNHTFFTVFNEEEPVLCLMKYRLGLSISPGDELVIDIPRNLGRYVVPINITNELSEQVTVDIIALPSNAVTEPSRDAWAIAYMPSRKVTVPADSSTVINACIGRYRVRAWGMNSPENISLETWLDINDSSETVVITVPSSMGGGALTIKPGECVAAVNVSGEGINVSLRDEEVVTMLLSPGEYVVSAELGECGIINAPERFVTEVSLGVGDDVVVEVPPPPARLTIGNDVDYELVVSIVNSSGGMVHAITLRPSSLSVLEVWPGNYTVIANPLTRPGYYVGPISGLKWEASVSLGWGDRAVLSAEPSASSVLEIVGPPGAEVFLKWGTSSARYTIPPGGVLRLLAAPVTYNISSCPNDIFHSCWSTTTDPSGMARVVVEYGLRPDTVAGTVIAIAAVAVTAYFVVRRRGWSRRTRQGVTEAPP